MRTVVTGGAGFIGSHLAEKLLLAGHEVIIIDNFFRGLKSNLAGILNHPGLRLVEADIRKRSIWPGYLDGADIVFHLAAQSNVLGAVHDLKYSFETNVIGTFNLLEECAARKVRQFIFSSSREVYGEAQELPVTEQHPLLAKNAYGASKAAGELYVRVFQNSGQLNTVIFRLANVYGRRDFNRVIPIFIDNCRKQEDIKIFGGEQVIDFVYVGLITEAMIRAIGRDDLFGTVLNIGSGSGTTLYQLADQIIRLTGSESKISVLPARTVEVVRFVADTTLMEHRLGISRPENPIGHLEEITADGE